MAEDKKVDHFFRLLRGIYGASKFSAQWPTDLDLHASKKLWSDQIISHTPEELRAAIDHAQRMAINGEQDWQWPNIGLILSGAKRYATAAHRPYIAIAYDPPPLETRRQLMAKIRLEAGL